MDLPNGMKRFLAAVALRLFDTNDVSRCLGFDAKKVQEKVVDLFQSLTGFDVVRFATLLNVTRNLNQMQFISFHFISFHKPIPFDKPVDLPESGSSSDRRKRRQCWKS